MIFNIGIFKIFSGLVITDNNGINEAKENISPKPQMHIKTNKSITCFFLFSDK